MQSVKGAANTRPGALPEAGTDIMQAAGTAERDHEAPDTEVAERARAEENSRQLFVGG